MKDPGPEEETWDEFRGVEPGGPAPEAGALKQRAHRRRQVAERLLAEWLATREEERLFILHEERFQTQDFFDLLVAEGHAALPEDAARAGELTAAAVHVAYLLDERGHSVGSEGLSRACCLAGTARRLLGDFPGAEEAFERAGFLQVDPPARGFFCRCLGLLRWDQGRTEEAAALLHHAVAWFAENGSAGEQGACRALLGLLRLQEGETCRAAPYFERACRTLSAGREPWLAAMSGLGLAFCFAVHGDPEKARAARKQAWSHYGGVRGEDALLALYWLEGRAAAAAGEAGDAAHLLASVRQKLLSRRCLLEATLATVDLGLALDELGRAHEVDALVAELAAAFAGSPGLDLALAALESFAEGGAAGRLDREVWTCVAPALRLAFRVQGMPPRPVPFA